MKNSDQDSLFHSKTNIAVTKIDITDQQFDKEIYLVMPLYNVRGVLNWELSAKISTPVIFVCGTRSNKKFRDYCHHINIVQTLFNPNLENVNNCYGHVVKERQENKTHESVLNVAPTIIAEHNTEYWLKSFNQSGAINGLRRDLVRNSINSTDFDDLVNSYFKTFNKGNAVEVVYNQDALNVISDENRDALVVADNYEHNIDQFAKFITLNSTLGSVYDSAIKGVKALTEQVNALHLNRLTQYGLVNDGFTNVLPNIGYFPVYLTGKHSQPQRTALDERVKAVVKDALTGNNSWRVTTEILSGEFNVSANQDTFWMESIPSIEDSFIDLAGGMFKNLSISEQWELNGLSGYIGIKI
ncbi:hypothetical protein [Photobacterium leiognathi]|uniref:hypothetical protein n=1 Tax=Photobacterium leiognathi TaxID=553611 RepID=UPI00273964A6|nr:hypothetical protein [Photobacterium leiognathi]